jgi:hypothetical protein
MPIILVTIVTRTQNPARGGDLDLDADADGDTDNGAAYCRDGAETGDSGDEDHNGGGVCYY